jgi:hypothetical protein
MGGRRQTGSAGGPLRLRAVRCVIEIGLYRDLAAQDLQNMYGLQNNAVNCRDYRATVLAGADAGRAQAYMPRCCGVRIYLATALWVL